MEKHALITGATSGIGEATARRLAADGYALTLTGRRADRLEALADGLRHEGAQVRTLCFDVRDEQACRRAMEQIPASEPIDVLVNNAGLAAGLEPVDEGALEDWETMIDTNIKGLLYMTRLVSRRMIEAGRGHILSIGSIAGTQPYGNGAVYCATKHAVHAISQAIRGDLVQYGIRVSEIRPGMVETEFSTVRFHGDRERAAAVYRGIEPLTGADIAEAIAWVIALPAHVNVDDMLITPSQQVNAYTTWRRQ